MSTKRQIVLSLALVAAALGVAGAFTFAGKGDPAQEAATEGHQHGAAAGGGDELRPVRLDDESARRIGVTYATATVKPLARTVSTVGNVTWDETRLANLSPKIEGWVEHLYVDFTGASVERGQPLLAIYSPMLVVAQEELILALRLADEATASGGDRAAANAQDLLESARRRLRYWDIPEEEIGKIEETRAPTKTLVLNAPASGIVVEKMVVEGARIMPGMDVYRIADLSRVWVEGEVFEKDLSLVRLGQGALVTFEAYPGEVFSGPVTYVYPTVSVEARTGRVRVELANPGLRLKPGMYAKVELAADPAKSALTIPRSAVHFTGERALVFVRGAGGVLNHRPITTGLALGNDIEVLTGLAEGEVVVSSANFLIDAEANMGSSMEAIGGGGGGEAAPPAPAGGEHAGHGQAAPAAEPGGTEKPAPARATGHEGHEPPPANAGHAGHVG